MAVCVGLLWSTVDCELESKGHDEVASKTHKSLMYTTSGRGHVGANTAVTRHERRIFNFEQPIPLGEPGG